MKYSHIFEFTVKILEVLRPFVSLIPEVSKPERKVSEIQPSLCGVVEGISGGCAGGNFVVFYVQSIEFG